MPHHNPTLNIDEDVMWKGTVTFVRIIHNMLQIEKKNKAYLQKAEDIYKMEEISSAFFVEKSLCAAKWSVI